MYARCHLLKRIVSNVLTPTAYHRQIRFQSASAGEGLRNFEYAVLLSTVCPHVDLLPSSSTNSGRHSVDDVFLDLTTDYNRKRFVQSDLLTDAIKNINSNISERLSLLILTAAARCVHHVTPDKRVELLEAVSNERSPASSSPLLVERFSRHGKP